MLVLSRKWDEKIIIGDPGPGQVVITVAEIRGDKVRLAIDAPKAVPIFRRELVWCELHQYQIPPHSRCPECVGDRKERANGQG